jgi:hypothetical protein
MRVTRTELYYAGPEATLLAVNAMEEAGWAVRVLAVMWSSTLFVVYERDTE